MNALQGATPAATATYQIHRYPAALIEPVALRDGRRAIVRPVLPQDGEALQQFVRGLSLTARRRRFHAALNHLPLAVLRDMTAIDYRRHVALVAQEWAHEDARRAAPHGGDPSRTAGPSAPDAEDEPRLVGDARYVVIGERRAEFAVVVADDWQGQGLGTAMLTRLARHARARGIDHLEGLVLEDNEPMLALAQRLGARWQPAAHDRSVLLATFEP